MLPSSSYFDGTRSVKQTALSDLVYKTLELFHMPKMLAVACWDQPDWSSVMSNRGMTTASGSTVIEGFWEPQQPRWLHLSPQICQTVQGLLDDKRPSATRAYALTTVIHESLHAHGVSNEAQTNCYAVQLVPDFGLQLGMTAARADYLGKLAVHYTRRTAPGGYWNALNCTDGGKWDLLLTQPNLA
jgi:hypothetical protein